MRWFELLQYAYLDGVIIEADGPHLSLDDRGFHFGDGLFETVLVKNGHALFLIEHLQRMEQGAEVLGLEMSVGTEDIKSAIKELNSLNKAGSMLAKLMIWRRGSADALAPATSKGRAAIICRAVPEYPSVIYEQGIEVSTIKMDRSSLGYVKSLCYLPSVLARGRSAKSGTFETIFIDKASLVEEGATSNILFVKDRTIIVPMHNGHILAGVTQKSAVRIAEQIGPEVRYENVWHKEVPSMDEMMLTNTSAGIVPVKSVDGIRIGIDCPGPITELLRKEYENLVTVTAHRD